jgi:DUF4097 and DUF4098 domain-containing protein YvlB
MNSNRAALVGMLVAVEILIAGLVVWSIGGAGHLSAAGLPGHQVDFTAKAIAPIDAGATPHVVISDPSSGVRVGVSADGRVHVRDLTNTHGTFFSHDETIPQVAATRTADGVAIERPSYDSDWTIFSFGSSERRIQVDVPAGTHLDIQKSNSAEVTGVTGGATVRSLDGHVTLTDLQGTVNARSADGSVTASNIHGDSLTVESADGHLTLHDIAVEKLSANTSNGRVDATGLTIAGTQPSATLHSNDGSVHAHGSFAPGGTYEVSSNDGRVELGLAPGSDLTVELTTGDGGIYVDGKRSSDDDAQHQTLKLGSGSGAMRVSSADGSIHLSTNGAL